MAAAVLSQVTADISGTINGQIAVGDHIIQNNVDHGGIIYNAAPGETPVPQLRPLPVRLAGRKPPEPIGRTREIQAAIGALASATPVEFVGPPGIGKTTLLKHLGHDPPAGASVDGVVYHEALGEAVEDSLQHLYETFYETRVPFKPTRAQIRHGLRDIRAMVVLDDIQADRNGVAEILDTLPSATFVLGSARRSLWVSGCSSFVLRGLGRDDAVELLARELGRPLDEGERQVAAAIADGVKGQPLQLQQAAALVSTLGYELAELADELAAGAAPEDLGQLLLATLDDEQQRILEVLTALGGATLPADQLADLADVPEAGPVIASLMQLGLVQAHSPRYSVTNVVEPPAPTASSASIDEAARAHMTAWVEARSRDPQAVVREIQAILAILRAASRDQAWSDVLRLGRAAEGPLLLACRWGAWREVLEHELVAARRLGDRAAEAWALHQMGSRSLCLGDRSDAWTQLTSALRIREQLGDGDGAAATRHNLDLLVTKPPARRGGWRPWPRLAAVLPAGLPPFGAGLPFVTLVAILGLAVGGVLWWQDTGRALPPPAPTAPSLSVAPNALVFGPQRIDTTSSPRTVTVSNGGDGDLVLGSVTTAGARGAYRVERNGCATVTLRPGARCSLAIVFAPSVEGLQQADLTLAAKDLPAKPVPLNGVGTSSSPGELGLEPATVDFGAVAVGTTASRNVRVSNRGGTAFELRPTVTGRDAPSFSVSAGGCPPSLPAGGTCTFAVAFSPTQLGLRAGAVSAGGEASSLLTGTGTSPPPPPASGSIDLQVPAAQTIAYGAPLDVTVTASVTPQPTGPPEISISEPSSSSLAGLTFRDNGDGTATLRGTVLANASSSAYEIGFMAKAVPDLKVSKPFRLTVVPADVSLRWSQPVLNVGVAETVSVDGTLTRVGSPGTLAGSRVAFSLTPCAIGVGPTAVDGASGRLTLTLQVPTAGLYTVKPRLVETANVRLVSAQPLTLLVVPLVLSKDAVLAEVLTDALDPLTVLPCLPPIGI